MHWLLVRLAALLALHIRQRRGFTNTNRGGAATASIIPTMAEQLLVVLLGLLRCFFRGTVHAACGIVLLIFRRRQVMYSLVNLHPFTNGGTADAILGGEFSKTAAGE